MKGRVRILIISDTHGSLPPGFWKYLESVDELWHAGDFGNSEILESLQGRIKVRGVFGNIDGLPIRKWFPENLTFQIAGVKVAMRHIAGKPGKYTPETRLLIEETKPDVLVCGHSHILRIEYDKTHQLMFLNPGAMGNQGFHKVKSCLRFTIENGALKDMEIIEFPR
jgi:putative phosphoesterase